MIATLIFIMLFMGFLGGIINVFLNSPLEQEEQKDSEGSQNASPTISASRDIFKNSIIGIGAAAMVPLFLNMISSNLLKDILAPNSDSNTTAQNLFVFAGFCLIAGISSRAFIQNLSEKVLQKMQQQVNSTEEKTKELDVKFGPLLENAMEPESAASGNMLLASPMSNVQPTNDELKILQTLASGPYTLRSISGISKDSAFDKETVHDIVNTLMNKGFVGQTDGGKKGPRWYITSQGRESI